MIQPYCSCSRHPPTPTHTQTQHAYTRTHTRDTCMHARKHTALQPFASSLLTEIERLDDNCCGQLLGRCKQAHQQRRLQEGLVRFLSDAPAPEHLQRALRVVPTQTFPGGAARLAAGSFGIFLFLHLPGLLLTLPPCASRHQQARTSHSSRAWSPDRLLCKAKE